MKTQEPFHCCDWPDCPNKGEYRAPKDNRLQDYYLFCLEHVRIYNKNWDYYKDFTPGQIEQSIRQDTVWGKPSWKMGENVRLNTASSAYNFHQTAAPKHRLSDKHSPRFLKACEFMEITEELTLTVLKQQYKKLAKKYHPDVNNNPNASTQFRQLQTEYEFLLKYLTDK